jgi:hypothetical protein
VALLTSGLVSFLVHRPRTLTGADSRSPASLPGHSGRSCSLLHEEICSGKLFRKDPTGIVRDDRDGELAASDLYDKIIAKHPDWDGDQVDDVLVRRIYTPERRQKVARAFTWVRKRIERLIDHEPVSTFSFREKRLLKHRLRAVQLQLPPPAKIYADEPDLLTTDDIYYERLFDGSMRLRIGGAYLLGAQSYYNLVFTMGHELAHSIDPCEMRVARLSFPAYDHLTACFMETHVITMRKTRLECGHDDQLSEAFADWIAVQVTAEALNAVQSQYTPEQLFAAAANSVRDLCEDPGEDPDLLPDLSLHPAPTTRIERIFGNNPKIRKLLSCQDPPANPVYCDFNWRSGTGR